MGLDISAYSKLVLHDDQTMDMDAVCENNLVKIWVNPDFPEAADGLADDAIYSYTEEFDFRAGSYHGYNRWRNELACLAGYEATEAERFGVRELRYDETVFRLADLESESSPGPFFQLICFSDCEGWIGPLAAQKLAKDFSDHQAKADAYNDDAFRRLYSAWRKAFELAADGGGVRFH